MFSFLSFVLLLLLTGDDGDEIGESMCSFHCQAVAPYQGIWVMHDFEPVLWLLLFWFRIRKITEALFTCKQCFVLFFFNLCPQTPENAHGHPRPLGMCRCKQETDFVL